MRQWVRQWQVTIRWDRAEHSPRRTTRYETYAATWAELRRLIEAARADPHVTAFPYRSVRVLVGQAPTHCPAGHRYPEGRIAGRLPEDWAPCGCGGHHILLCEPGCPSPRVADPPVYHDCDTSGAE